VSPGLSEPAGGTDGRKPPRGWLGWVNECIRRAQPFRIAIRVFVVLALAVVAALVYLSAAGVPGFLTRKLLNQLQYAGFFVQLTELRFDVRDGLVASGVRFYRDDDETVPVMEAETLSLYIDFLDLFTRAIPLRGFTMQDGVLRLATGEGPLKREGASNIVLERVAADIRIAGNRIEVEEMSARFIGLRVSAAGLIVREPREGPGPRTPVRSRVTEPLERLGRIAPEWVPRLVEELNALEFVRPPEAEIDFTIHLGAPQQSEISANLSGGRTRTRGVFFDAWSAAVKLRKNELRIDELLARHRENHLRLSGRMDLGTGVAEAHVFNDLPATHWANLVPRDWRRKWEEAGFLFTGPVRCELDLGPAPLGEVYRRMSGCFSLREAEIRGVWLEEATVELEKDEQILELSRVDAMVGRSRNRGPVKAQLRYDLQTRAYRGHLDARFNPHALLSVLTLNQQRIARAMVFDDGAPAIEVAFAGRVGDKDAFSWWGELAATNFFYNGAYLRSFRASGSLTNRTMVLDPLRIERGEGALSGRAEQNFQRKTVTLDVVNTADPKVLARALGPKPERAMRIYRVNGPTRMKIDGVVDYSTNYQSDVRLTMQAEDFGVLWLVADRCAFDLRMKNRTIAVTNITGSLYGGAFTAAADFVRVGSKTNVGYDIQFAGTNLNFSELVANLREPEQGVYEGLLSGHTRVEGIIGEGRGDTARGTGALNIREGALFRIPLLGGLSSMLSRLNPGWDFGAQTDFSASFTIAERNVHSEDIRLEGNAITLLGEGEYSFNGDLEFDIKVQPRGESRFAEMVQLVTSPVTALLSFHLDGTLDDPKWRPQNLPKELFFIRD